MQFRKGMKNKYPIQFLKNITDKIAQISGYIFYFFNATSHKNCKRINNNVVKDFAVSVLFNIKQENDYVIIENHRKKLEKDKTLIEINDLGAGSKITYQHCKTIASIARYASVTRKTGRLLYRLTHYYKPGLIIELGTSLGISTLYLATGCPSSRAITIEADRNLAALASGYFMSLGLTNISVINKSFDEALQMFPAKINEKTIVFIDGNHQKQAVISYVGFFSRRLQSGSMIVIDDINWSAGMQQAWKEIRSDKNCPVTIDLFYLGIVLFQQNKENFQIRF